MLKKSRKPRKVEEETKAYYSQHTLFLIQEYFEVRAPVIIQTLPTLNLHETEES